MKALEALNICEEIYLESYTSVSEFTSLQLQRLLGKPIRVLDRKQTEEDLVFLEEAEGKKVALLVHGDPLAATTHQEILQLAKKKEIQVQVIHAPSIFTAIAETGLSLYRFGKTTSIPIPTEDYKPESFFDVLKANLEIEAHTLFLLEIRNLSEAQMRPANNNSLGKTEQNQALKISEAIKILLDINKNKNSIVFTEDTFCVAAARLGADNSVIKAGKVSDLAKEDFGESPYVLIVPSKLNHKEQEYIQNL